MYNYLYYKDAKSGKTFIVTFSYCTRGYGFAIQSLTDNHCEATGRKIADERRYNRNSSKFGSYVSWNDIKAHFEHMRKNVKFCYMFGIIDAMRIPSHLSRAELLERPTTKGDSNGQN